MDTTLCTCVLREYHGFVAPARALTRTGQNHGFWGLVSDPMQYSSIRPVDNQPCDRSGRLGSRARVDTPAMQALRQLGAKLLVMQRVNEERNLLASNVSRRWSQYPWGGLLSW